MLLPRSTWCLLLATLVALLVGCGGSSLDRGSSGGEAGAAETGGTSAGGSDTGGSSSGVGGSKGGAGGAGGAGGSTGGAGGSTGGAGGVGGSLGGLGGSASGSGGTAAAAGCGFCAVVACAPAVMLDVTAPADIADLQGEVTNLTTGETVGELYCSPNGATGTCSWFCQLYQLGSAGGDYAIELTAPGYQTKTVEFSVEVPSNCGCCGCGCGASYSATVELASSGVEPPACCSLRETDPTNCGVCGNVCASGQPCTGGVCGGTDVACTDQPPRFPTFDRSCQQASDCVVVEHTTSCCGSTLMQGLRAGEKAAFDAAEVVCDGQYPPCGCAAQWVDVEDGTQIPFDQTDQVKAVCEDNECRAVYEAMTFDCLDKRCTAGSYCSISTGGPVGSEPTASCLPTSCTDCECLGVVGCECVQSEGHLEVICNNP